APRAGDDVAAHAADRELVRLCLAGVERAQRELIDRLTPLAFAFCRRSGLAPDEAEDVCQDVLLDVLRGLPRYRGQARLTTWGVTLITRRIADYFRSPQRRHVPSGAPGDATFPEPLAGRGPEAELMQSNADAKLRTALDGLGHPACLIVTAYYLG